MTPLIQEALAERGYDTLTPVQEAVTDPALIGHDLLVSAQTGSGKTVGFGLAIAPTLLGDDERFGRADVPMALCIAPTRELALQVMRELEWLYAKTGARVTSCVGGMDVRTERRALDRGAHIVVGTPGRLRDHIERGALDMTGLRAIVLDEADEMLDLGFREDLEFMLGAAPADRRTLMFSATVPPTIAKMAQQFQNDAKRVNTVGNAKQHTDISYEALRVAPSDSEHAIFNLLRFHDAENAIVFANTRAAVAHLTARLSNRGLPVVSLSGELSQNERTHALQAMRDGRARVCVATDVAARGIDLPNLDLVIHADLPTNTESLLHRSGRTGRAGRKGVSALIVPPRAAKKAERLLKWAKITATWGTAPSAEDISRRDEERLLNDPAWGEPLTEEQTTFAAKLLALHSPEVIAAAYLRLYQADQGAPEELQAPDAKPERKERKPFGPSRWFSLSVGQDEKAEARWLLPLILRAGNLEKSAIGAIRVQGKETYVELTEASAAGFLKAIGPDGELEDGIRATAMDKAPDLPARGPKRDGGGGGRSFDKKPYDKKPYDKKPYEKKSYDKGPRGEGARGPKRESFDKPDRPKGPGSKKKFDDKRAAQNEDGVTTPYKSKGKPAANGDKPRWAKDDKPKWDKPKGAGGKPGGKPKFGGKPSGKPGGKASGKPGAKPKGKPGSKPGAANASQSLRGKVGRPFGKPGGTKGGAKTGPKGGNARPKRRPE
ncbi:MAG: DEAD/DEAH box helicase [Maritimibacter sp.]